MASKEPKQISEKKQVAIVGIGCLTVAIFVLLAAFLTAPNASLYNELASVCSGAGYPNAHGLDPLTTEHPTAVIGPDGKAWESGRRGLGDGWHPGSIEETELVLCLNEASGGVDVYCAGPLGDAGVYYGLEGMTARLYDAKTGEYLKGYRLASRYECGGETHNDTTLSHLRELLKRDLSGIISNLSD